MRQHVRDWINRQAPKLGLPERPQYDADWSVYVCEWAGVLACIAVVWVLLQVCKAIGL